MDSFLSEKQMRLLTTPLYAGWRPGTPFVVAANVGVFVAAKNPAIVPDVLVSLDVEMPALTGPERVRSYFVWELGKVPDIVIEIVSDAEGGELSSKLRAYERMRVPHYVVFDPLRKLESQELMTFSLDGALYTERDDARFVSQGLALTRWMGSFEGRRENWLRWTDLDGRLFPTPEESEARADDEKARADDEKARADDEKARADDATAEAARAKQRAEELAARLRALGIEPDG
ncbi:MAG: Uma2 family endonuclease [Labilithrix sp.]|nr:Uma2 family endonuclease [Labilithrix sp.]MCW5812225.1 Uma2 family endonuclease [Labilithrix sp.]